MALRESSFKHPLTDAEIDEANAYKEDLWIHIKCKSCGDVECCFNNSFCSQERLCFLCSMGIMKRSSGG
jgi:hypothetical protein